MTKCLKFSVSFVESFELITAVIFSVLRVLVPETYKSQSSESHQVPHVVGTDFIFNASVFGGRHGEQSRQASPVACQTSNNVTSTCQGISECNCELLEALESMESKGN
jgi:hypothetical protein